MSENVLVVRGGTLIDGTGRPPLDNSVIVMRDGRFAAIGRDGEVAVPPSAEVIDVNGRTVLPGFIDGHAHLEDFHGELYLHLGITSAVTIAIFQDGPWTLALTLCVAACWLYVVRHGTASHLFCKAPLTSSFTHCSSVTPVTLRIFPHLLTSLPIKVSSSS